MKISAVIPCHNSEQWISGALDSVSDQTLPPIEVIVIDDGSSDRSAKVVDQHRLKPKLLRANFRNAAASRNEAVRHATGDWIAFLDADDRWLPKHLELVQKTLASDDVAAFSLHRRVYNGHEQSDPRNAQDVTGAGSGLRNDDLVARLIRPNSGWATPSMVVRRDRFNQVGGFDEAQVRRHDAEMFCRLVHDHSWTLIPEETWCYRVGTPGSISSNTTEVAYYWLTALQKIRSLYDDPRLDAMVANRARVAIGAAVRSGNSELIGKIYADAGRQLPLHWRASKLLWTNFPGLVAKKS